MKSTTDKPLACDDLWNERQAHMALVQTIEQNKQDDLRVTNHQTIKKESDRKESVNQQFWHRIWVSCNVLLLLVVIYGLFQFFTR